MNMTDRMRPPWPLLSPLLSAALLLGACTSALHTSAVPADRQVDAPAATATSTAITPAPAAQAPSTWPTPPDAAYPQLFAAVQAAQLFEDQKLFADAVPREAPATIAARYADEHTQPGFDLRAFVGRHFTLPEPAHTGQVAPQPSLRAHIDALWPLLTRHSERTPEFDSLLPLPLPYAVPGGRFREMYYWDSYFTMLGLVDSGRNDLAGAMVADFAHLIDAYGHIPNGTRSYYLSRSQPPFFSYMVELAAQHDPSLWRRYLPQLRREHAYWMDGADALAPGQAARRVVRLADGSVLNRYWDDRDTPRPEAFEHDRATAAEAEGRPAAEVWRDLRASAESGWDFSSRWLDDGRSLHTVHTTSIVPVDLNSLLFHLESSISRTCGQTGDQACANDYTTRAQRRQAAMEAHLWNPDGYYTDYDLRSGKPRAPITAAALYPLFAGTASRARARATAASARKQLLRPGGLATTTVDTGQQWDAPNAWAPLQWVAIAGLRGYEQDALAKQIAGNFLGNVQAVFDKQRKLVEKYDERGPHGGGGGEYPLQDGFGWSNGVAHHLMVLYPDLERAPPR